MLSLGLSLKKSMKEETILKDNIMLKILGVLFVATVILLIFQPLTILLDFAIFIGMFVLMDAIFAVYTTYRKKRRQKDVKKRKYK